MLPAPKDILADWPGAIQIVRCQTQYIPRHPRWKVRKDETRFFVLFGPPGARRLGAKRLASLVQGHWGIENRQFHALDRTFLEDGQTARCGAVAMCMLRTASLTVLQREQAALERTGRRRYMPELRARFNADPHRAAAALHQR